MIARVSCLCALSLLLIACGDGPATDAGPPDDAGPAADGAVPDASVSLDAGPDAAPDICIGIRGNGELITAHFAALSRFVEHYGMPAGGAGGSSASITLFMLESVSMNPLVQQCGDRACTAQEANDRAALLLKSFPGYIDVLLASDEALSFGVLQELVTRISNRDVQGLLETDTGAAVDALRTILDSADLAELVNPEVRALLTGDHPVFHTRDIVGALAGGTFNASDHLIFIRPGVLSFPALANNLGNVGSFYAGYEPADTAAVSTWLDACAGQSHGRVWTDVAALPAESSTCGELFAQVVTEFRASLSTGTFPSRADDEVGGSLRLAIATGVLENDAVTTWDTARDDYLNARDSSLDINFSDVRIGYFGTASDTGAAVMNPRGFTDFKTSKALDLGPYSWRRILSMSPAEPGLSRGIALDDGRISVGGWPDLQPTLILRNMGCDKVVYLTRRGGNSQFGGAVASLLGISDAQLSGFLDFDNPDSSAYDSIAESDAVWCTDWDSFSGLQIAEITADAFNAPLETTDPFFTMGADPYPNASAPDNRPGCTLGVVPTP